MSQFNLSDKYVLSLDNLDLSLLGQFVEKPLYQNKLIWSNSSINGESTYYVVKINEDAQAESSYIELADSYMCHICNIDVPKVYLKQHNKSRQHYSCKKLIEKALENASKEITVDTDSYSFDKFNYQFYCEICSKVVSLENKQKHKKSEYHLKSIERQKLTDNFIGMYVEGKEVETVDIKIESNGLHNKVHDHINNYTDTDTSQFSEDSSDDKHIKKNKQVFPKNAIQNCCKSTNTTVSESSSTVSKIPGNVFETYIRSKMNNFVLYIREMIAKYNIECKMPIIENDSIIIATPQGFKEYIAMDAFHGYKTINNVVYCQLCKIWLDCNTSHINSENHVRSILQPVNDSFVREVVGDLRWSHCLICNNMVVTGSKHATQNPNHSSYFINSAKTGKKEKKRKIYCHICNEYLQTHNLFEHNNSNKHRNNIFFNSIKHSKRNYLYCKVCKIYTPNNSADEIHEEGKIHLQNLIKVNKSLQQIYLELNNLKMKDKMFSQKSLPAAVTMNPQAQNIVKVLTIQEKLYEYNKLMNEISAMKVECMICHVDVSNINNDIIKHVESLEHKTAMDILLDEHKMVQKSIKMYFCAFCKLDINDFVIHINENVDHMIKVLLHYKINKKELRKYVYKNPRNNDPLALAYRQVHKQLLQENKIERLNATNFFCNVCSISVQRNDVIEHMFARRHRSNF